MNTTVNNKAMWLSELLFGLVAITEENDRQAMGLTDNSLNVSRGIGFIALPGSVTDGRAFIADAIARGASFVLAEGDQEGSISHQNNVPIIEINKLRQKVSAIAATFYGNPAAEMTVLGVTGTNGKSSCVHFLAQALHKLGVQCGQIGTLGWGLPGAIQPSNLTTPSPITLQAQLADLKKSNITHLAMEMSSHALEQGRAAAIQCHVGIFTNLSHEHLDYHGSMAAYADAKMKLFQDYGIQYAVMNVDDPVGQEMIKKLPEDVVCLSYSRQVSSDADVLAHHWQSDLNGFRADIKTPWGDVQLVSKLIGSFNVSNMLAVVTTLGALGYPMDRVTRVLGEVEAVPGRLQPVRGPKGCPLTLVDYAHTPDALAQVLSVLRQCCHGQLWCVFGCGGNRDAAKRSLMGKIASQWCDSIVVTNDNPRHEEPKVITDMILDGMTYDGVLTRDNVIVIHDRAKAIEYALSRASEKDLVLVAGKGHEDYQIIGSEKKSFSDLNFIKATFANLNTREVKHV